MNAANKTNECGVSRDTDSVSGEPAGLLAVAESRARACYDALYRHVEHIPRCGCRLESGASFPAILINPGCLLGAAAMEEYKIATATLREIAVLLRHSLAANTPASAQSETEKAADPKAAAKPAHQVAPY